MGAVHLPCVCLVMLETRLIESLRRDVGFVVFATAFALLKNSCFGSTYFSSRPNRFGHFPLYFLVAENSAAGVFPCIQTSWKLTFNSLGEGKFFLRANPFSRAKGVVTFSRTLVFPC